ncbi:WYL domain-containing protein [Rhodanobacter sp. DHG33]|uniref:WYL domain-containing protein n=1 Tax=Rhodanobacter sp. DHG33 TaxID=2775921 RepID=UPI001783B980|nr:WYL domain-containing protein [Rhodanobacter sp. DHG33]MBD8900357.1 WYL domain-containing protein [Rhodanobacter sp. DHG33]
MSNPSFLERAPRKDLKIGRWGQERRLEFIDYRLYWDGRINRSELVEFFGISIQQASLDIARYTELALGNLEYDRSEKVYRAATAFTPILTSSNAQSFLDPLLGVTIGTLPLSSSFLGWLPPTDVVAFPVRSIQASTLTGINQAIRYRQDIELEYQSMRQPASTRRWIAPHAIAFDGMRWHARAWCYSREEFRDFVFSRIQTIYQTRPTHLADHTDVKWNTYNTVILRPKKTLSPAQQRAVEIDFGMTNGELHVPMRQALVFYFLRQLHLTNEHELQDGQPIELANKDELSWLIVEAHKR